MASFHRVGFTAVIVSVISFFPLKTSAQRNKVIPAWEVRSSYGFVVPHHLDMGVYTRTHFSLWEISASLKVAGDKPWHKYYRAPYTGVSYGYSSLGNTKILGDVHSLLPWIRFPVYSGSFSGLSMRTGIGLGYFRRTFDRYGNYKNLAIGSHLNANFQLHAEYHISLTPYWMTSLVIGVSHFSNGSMRMPNYGINVPHAGIGMAWRPEKHAPHPRFRPQKKAEKYWVATFSGSAGIKEILPAMGSKYAVYSTSAGWAYHAFYTGSLGAALDLSLDLSDKEVLSRLTGDTVSTIDCIKPGISLFREWELGKMAVSFAMGGYLYERDVSDGSLYHKLSMKYYTNDHLYLLVFLKTHFAKADFIGWGVGWRLHPFNTSHHE